MNKKVSRFNFFALLTLLLLASPLAAQSDIEHCATASINDQYGSFKDGTVLYMPGIGEDYVFTPGAGVFIERADGTASLTGTVRNPSDPADAFLVDIQLSGYTTVPEPGNPYITLDPSAYAVNGGPVDTTTWHYYRFFDHAQLTGIDGNAGAIVELSRRGGAWQMGEGANNHNINFGVASWISWFVVQQPDTGTFQPAGEGEIFLDLGGCEEICVEQANVDPVVYGGSGGHALWLPGIGKDFVFFGEPGTFVEQPDGTALFTGTVYRVSNPNQGFAISVMLDGYTTTAPPGSPKRELRSSAYVDNGGPIDPSTWWYYPDFIATLTGVGEYAGAVVELTTRGPAWQTGFGANGKNANFGASMWFNYQVLEQPSAGPSLRVSGHGDFNVDLVDCVELLASYCPAPALGQNGGWAAGSADHAITLPGIAHDMWLLDGAFFGEFSDGTARFIGTAYDVNDPGNLLDFDVTFTGATSVEPAGSPKKELPSWAYVDNGGPIDPSTWWYYTDFTGTFTGRDNWEGAVVEIGRTGPSFQVGVGASNKDFSFGASGWVDYVVVSQPLVGGFSSGGDGDFNLSLECPEPSRATIGDRVWKDVDGNGNEDAGESGISGVTVELLYGANVVATTTTDGGGYYSFEVAPGLYTVRIVTSTLGNATVATADFDGLATPHEAQVSVVAGEIQLDVDFGYKDAYVGPLPPQNTECVGDDFEDGSLHPSWSFAYLGNADQGGAAEAGGVLELSGDGTTFYTGDDTGAFLHQTADGDFRAEVELEGFPADNGGTWRKAGLMVRDGATGDRAPRIAVQVVSSNPATGRPSLQFTYRSTNGATGGLVAGEVRDFVSLPIKLAIERRGAVFTVSYSTDGGASWIVPNTSGGAQGMVTIPALAGPVLVGPNVVSYDASTTLTTAFDDFQVCAPNDSQPTPPPSACVPGADVDLIYLLDRSGSMGAAFPASGSKLAAAQDAIVTLNDALATRGGVRAALLSFAGFDDVALNLAQSTQVESPFSTNLGALSSIVNGLDPADINSTTPTAIAIRETERYFGNHGDPGRSKVVVLITDGVPNIDGEGRGTAGNPIYALEEVQAISLYDVGGSFLPAGVVAWQGNYNPSVNTFDGEVLADTMVQVEELALNTGARVFGVAIQGDGVGLGTFNEDLLYYVSSFSNGVAYSATDADQLADALLAIATDIDCGEALTSTVGDQLWLDSDADGLKDGSEPGIPGVTVRLLVGGVEVDSATTDGSGNYLFTDVTTDVYTVEVDDSTLPPGLLPSSDFDGVGTPNSATVNVIGGVDRSTVDFGYEQEPPTGCGCVGKVTDFTLLYTGSSAADVMIQASRANRKLTIFTGTVNPGETLSLQGPSNGGPANSGTFGNSLDIHIDGVLHTAIVTDCTAAVGPGLVAGDFLVLDGTSKEGGPLCPVGIPGIPGTFPEPVSGSTTPAGGDSLGGGLGKGNRG
ncbi:MAG: SdrD B-like domain-containing protein [Acidobacteriota bacterium]